MYIDIKLTIMKMQEIKNPLKTTFLSLGMTVLVGFMVILSSCSDDDTIEMEPQNIVEVAVENGYTTLAAALVETGLDDDLAGSGPFTVFAPTDEAFADLGITASNVDQVENLEEILLYHVVSGNITSTDLSTGNITTLNGEGISIDAGNLTVNGISIAEPFDVEASNGIIHTINGVLLPPAPSIIETAAATPSLSILYNLIAKYPDIVNTLSGDGPFTVFAPTDQAFTNLLAVIGQADINNVPDAVVMRILQYHVIPGAVLSAGDLSDGQSASTALSSTDEVTVSIDGSTVMINNATVTSADIMASNGIVHIVDAVLAPALETSIINTIVEPAYFSKDFSILTAAVVEADLVGTLIDPAASFTLFAPNDAAFEAAGITSFEGIDLASVLTYHVLGSEVFASDLPSTVGGFAAAVPSLNGDLYLTNNDNGVFLNGNSQIVVATNTDGDLDYDNGVVHVINRTLVPASVDIIDIATSAGFTDLAAALTEADLVTALQGDGPFTVFAPTNEAFQTLYDALGENINGPEDVDPQLGDGTLAAILTYHVISERVFSSDLTDGLNAPTLQGETITVNIDGSVILTDKDPDVADPTVTGTDVLGTNGIVHIIDGVLLPIDNAL